MIILNENPSQINLEIHWLNQDGSDKTDVASSNVRVYRIVSGSESEILSTQAMSQEGSTGVWRYIWDSPTISADQYIVEYSSSDGSINAVTNEDLVIQTEVSIDNSAIADAVWDEVTSGHTQVGSFGELMYILKQIETGNWEVVNDQMIFYDSDGTTPLYTFDLSFQNPSHPTQEPYKREVV